MTEHSGLDGEPRSIYTGFDVDALERVCRVIADAPPLIAPVKLTREQLEEVKRLTGEPVVTDCPPLSSVRIEIVDRVEDSTPYLRQQEKFAAAIEAVMQVPYPQIELGDKP